MTVTFTLDGHPVRMADDWSATCIAQGGFDQFRGQVPTTDLDRISGVTQGSILKGVSETGHPVFYGRLVTNPGRSGNSGKIAAQGFHVAMRKNKARRLFQTRSYEPWKDASAPPYNRTVTSSMTARVESNQLVFTTTQASVANLDGYSLTLWTPGTVMTRLAFTEQAFGDVSGNYHLKVSRGTGPDGTLTQVEDHAIADTTKDLSGFATDCLVLEFWRNGSDTTTSVFSGVQLTNVRVGGLTTADVLYDGDVVSTLGLLNTMDVSGVRAGFLQVLPFDRMETDGALLDYLCQISDRCWLALDDRGLGVHLRYVPYGGNEWFVDSRGADWSGVSETPQEIANRFVVNYNLIGGTSAQEILMASPDPLFAKGIVNDVELELADEQPDSALAEQIAVYGIARVSKQSYSGGVTISRAVDIGGRKDIRAVGTGDYLTIRDFSSESLVQQRIQGVEHTATGVVATIGNQLSFDPLLGPLAFGSTPPPPFHPSDYGTTNFFSDYAVRP